jgi:hypothetical protein
MDFIDGKDYGKGLKRRKRDIGGLLGTFVDNIKDFIDGKDYGKGRKRRKRD